MNRDVESSLVDEEWVNGPFVEFYSCLGRVVAGVADVWPGEAAAADIGSQGKFSPGEGPRGTVSFRKTVDVVDSGRVLDPSIANFLRIRLTVFVRVDVNGART